MISFLSHRSCPSWEMIHYRFFLFAAYQSIQRCRLFLCPRVLGHEFSAIFPGRFLCGTQQAVVITVHTIHIDRQVVIALGDDTLSPRPAQRVHHRGQYLLRILELFGVIGFIFKQRGGQFPYGTARTTAVDQVGEGLLGFTAGEMKGLPIGAKHLPKQRTLSSTGIRGWRRSESSFSTLARFTGLRM